MGLFNRSYMRREYPGAPQSGDGMAMIWRLIGVNVAIFLLVLMVPQWREELMLTSEGMRRGQIYRLVTAAFLHLDFIHILLNMWGLYLFGTLAAPYLGAGRTLWLYLIGGISGNVLFLIFNWNSFYALLGASGAVYAITIAAAMLEPNRRFVLILMPMFPLKTSTMVVCFTIIEIISQLGGLQGQVAHLAHLGGFLGGYVYLKALRNLPIAWDPLRAWTGGGRAAEARRSGRVEYRPGDWSRPDVNISVDGSTPVPQREVDRLLDKISESGINSLTPEELATLRRVREQMKRQGR